MTDISKNKTEALHLAGIVMENAQGVCSMIMADKDAHNVDVIIYGMEKLLKKIIYLLGDEEKKMLDSNKSKAIELLEHVRDTSGKVVALLEDNNHGHEPEVLVSRMERTLQKVMNLME